jgi:hypothetical protein
MQIKPIKLFLFHVFIVAIILVMHQITFANEKDLLPVQQNRKLLKLNGAVTSMLEEKWVLGIDTAIYATTPSISLDSSFIMTRSEEAAFDKTGNILNLKTVTLVDAKDNITKDSLRYFYYEDGKLTGIANLLDNKKYDSMAFHYRKKGIMDYYKSLDVNNEIQYKVVYTYKDNKIVTIEREDAKHVPVSTIQLKYKGDVLFENQVFDEKLQLVESRRYASLKNKDGNIEESYAASDAKGNLKGGLTVTKDINGNILEQKIVDADRNISELYSYKYDASGNRIETKIMTGTQGIQMEFRYTFDQHNNWVKKETFTDDVLTSIITRKLDYGT